MIMQTQSRRKPATESMTAPTVHWLHAGHYDPAFAIAIEAKLNELASLQPNWDGYGASVIDPAIIAAARKFVASLPENLAFRPHVVPMSTGNLQLEWHRGSRTLELEFESRQLIHFLQWHPEAGVEEEDTIRADDVDRAVELIRWFMSGTCV